MKKLKLYGNSDTPEIYTIRDFLRRCVVEYDWIESDQNAEIPKELAGPNNNKRLPVIQFPDGKFLVNPSPESIAKNLGWSSTPKYKEYDLAIFGAGPAGLSAAVYAGSEGLRTVLIEKEAIGGQAGTSSLIENYMGFPEGISGSKLAEKARQQAVKFSVEILFLPRGIKGKFDGNKIKI